MKTAALKYRWLLQARALFLIGGGILLCTINQSSSGNFTLFLSLFMFFAACSGLCFASYNQTLQLKRTWLVTESLADIVFSMLALYFYLQPQDLSNDFTMAFSFLSLTFSFLQFTYFYLLFQVDAAASGHVILAKACTAVGYGIFVVVLLFKTSSDISATIINFIGIGPLVAGVVLLVLSNKIYFVNRY